MTGTPMNGRSSYEGLYQEILRSDRILDQLLDRNWNSLNLGSEASLYAIFDLTEPTGDTPESRLSKFHMKQLLRNKVIVFHRSKLNGYMKLKVTIPEDPPLAAELANFLVKRLDEHNVQARTGKAGQQREFIGTRLESVEVELASAESNLTNFLKSNRKYSSSPVLVQQHGELARQVQALTSIWTELRRQLELARIDEQKESVSVDVLDYATIPVFRSKPDRISIILLGTLFGLMLGSFAVLMRQQWRIWR